MTNRRQQTATALRVTIVRCCPAVIVLLLGLVVLFLSQLTAVSITGKRTWDIMSIIVATELAAYIWIRVFSRISLSRQLAAIGVLCGLQFCPCLSVRIDGFMGDGRPNPAWSWIPTAEEEMKAAESSLSTTDTVESTTPTSPLQLHLIRQHSVVLSAVVPFPDSACPVNGVARHACFGGIRWVADGRHSQSWVTIV